MVRRTASARAGSTAPRRSPERRLRRRARGPRKLASLAARPAAQRRSEPPRCAWAAADSPPPPRHAAAHLRSRKPSARARAPPRPPAGRARRRSAERWLVAEVNASRSLPCGPRPDTGRGPHGNQTIIRDPPATRRFACLRHASRMKRKRGGGPMVRRPPFVIDSPRAPRGRGTLHGYAIKRRSTARTRTDAAAGASG